MKRKAIEKIPYRTAELADMQYSHVGVAFTEEIKGAEHLFVEIYENRQESLDTPCLRFVFTKKDWENYAPTADDWSKSGLWDEPHGSYIKEFKECFMSDHGQDIVWTFCGEDDWISRKYDTWVVALDGLTNRIRRLRRDKRDDNRKKRLDDRIANTPELPEDLEEWADRRVFGGGHFLYYKRHGRYVDIACSACGKVFEIATKQKDTFEGQFEPVIPTPRNNAPCRCPECGAPGTWKSQGSARSACVRIERCFVAQPYKGTGVVIRYVEMKKTFTLSTCLKERKEVMTGAGERYSAVEVARRYLEKGKKPQTDYQKYSPYTGENFWDDCNLGGMGNITVRPGYIYEKSYETLKGTFLQYSGAREYTSYIGRFNLMDYLERYQEYPQIEMLTKMGLYGVVEKMVHGECGIIRNKNATHPEDFLGIRKSRMKLLIREKGNSELLRTLQKERTLEADWTEKEINLVQYGRIGSEDLKLVLKYTTMQKLTNKLGKYSGCEVPDTIEEMNRVGSCAINHLRTTVDTYFDYLRMRQQRGYDLHNTIYLYPRYLRAAHDRMVEEINGKQIKKRDQEVDQKYPDIKKNYRKLRNRYYYEDETYLIRPARSASEITREGRLLHHCVGGDNYLIKHNTGESTILFLRAKEDQETPYITVEIKGEEIRQWYGAYDRKPDQEQMEAWLQEYVAKLKEEKTRIRVA